ncbi:hypothetical protein ACLOJK_006277 [Asimina triloba]
MRTFCVSELLNSAHPFVLRRTNGEAVLEMHNTYQKKNGREESGGPSYRSWDSHHFRIFSSVGAI